MCESGYCELAPPSGGAATRMRGLRNAVPVPATAMTLRGECKTLPNADVTRERVGPREQAAGEKRPSWKPIFGTAQNLRFCAICEVVVTTQITSSVRVLCVACSVVFCRLSAHWNDRPQTLRAQLMSRQAGNPDLRLNLFHGRTYTSASCPSRLAIVRDGPVCDLNRTELRDSVKKNSNVLVSALTLDDK